MYLKLISVAAALLLLAACSSAPETPPPGGPGGPGGPPGGIGRANIAPGSQEDLKESAGDRVFFAFNSSEITSEGREILARQAEWLRRYPNVTITVEGHCDERGTREYNLALGARRAQAAKDVLVAAGVPASRVSTISYGKERPIVVGHDEEAWAQNRVAISRVN
jgi:peptidoglycan-associated lipoprotein